MMAAASTSCWSRLWLLPPDASRCLHCTQIVLHPPEFSGQGRLSLWSQCWRWCSWRSGPVRSSRAAAWYRHRNSFPTACCCQVRPFWCGLQQAKLSARCRCPIMLCTYQHHLQPLAITPYRVSLLSRASDALIGVTRQVGPAPLLWSLPEATNKRIWLFARPLHQV